MKIPSKLRRKWEETLPDLSGEWTHWKIIGDGIFLGVVSGYELVSGLDIVEENFEMYDSIKVCRAAVDSDGKIIEEEKFLIEVAHQLYNKREFNLK